MLATVLPLALLAGLAATPQLLGHRLAHAGAALANASPGWLWLAIVAFLVAVLGTVGAWRAAICATGTRLGRVDAGARYSVGCLVNTFAPGALGEAARVALLAQKVEGPNGFWTVGGSAAAVGALRNVTLCALVAAAVLLTGALPLWPIGVICGVALLTSAGAYALWRRHPDGRLGHFVGAFAALARSPRDLAAVVGWLFLSQTARLVGAAAVAAALSVPHPVLAAIVIVPTLQLATSLPVTPGSVGIATGAVALALQARGVTTSQALATGLAYQGAETIVGLSVGIAGTLAVLEVPPLVRRLAVAGACITVAGFVGATFYSLV